MYKSNIDKIVVLENPMHNNIEYDKLKNAPQVYVCKRLLCCSQYSTWATAEACQCVGLEIVLVETVWDEI